MATGLEHPRIVYPLPNGDVLVVEAQRAGTEPVIRPKDYHHWARSRPVPARAPRAATGSRCCATPTATASPELQHRLARQAAIRRSASRWSATTLYVANTDAIMRFPFTPGETQITAPGRKLTDLPGGPINHHWTKSLVASPDGSKLYVGVGSNSNITENGLGRRDEPRRDLGGRPRDRRQRIFAAACATRPASPFEPRNRQALGDRQRARRDRPRPRARLSDLGAGRRLLRLAVQLLGPARGLRASSRSGRTWSPRRSSPITRLSSHVAPLGLAFYTGERLRRRFAGGAFIGEHGSWDRSPLQRLQGGLRAVRERPAERPRRWTIVTGFLDRRRQAVRGRPVGVARRPDRRADRRRRRRQHRLARQRGSAPRGLKGPKS